MFDLVFCIVVSALLRSRFERWGGCDYGPLVLSLENVWVSWWVWDLEFVYFVLFKIALRHPRVLKVSKENSNPGPVVYKLVQNYYMLETHLVQSPCLSVPSDDYTYIRSHTFHIVRYRPSLPSSSKNADYRDTRRDVCFAHLISCSTLAVWTTIYIFVAVHSRCWKWWESSICCVCAEHWRLFGDPLCLYVWVRVSAVLLRWGVPVAVVECWSEDLRACGGGVGDGWLGVRVWMGLIGCIVMLFCWGYYV